MDNAAWIAALPKLDLHCHLDGSIRPQRIRDYLTALGEPVPEDFDRRIAVAEDCPSLTDYLRCFDLPLRWLQTQEGLEQAVVDLLWDVKVEHTRYLEVRFAPTLHLEGGLTYTQVFQALANGVERGERETGVCCRLIVCAMRHHTEEQNLAMLEAAKEFYPHLVCAADLAGDENAFPTDCHRAFFQRAKELGIPLILDEIQAGMGRSGDIWAFQDSGIVPDAMLISKAIGGSQPLSVVVYDRSLDAWTAGAHAGTFRGNQLAMAAGTVVLDRISSPAFLAAVKEKGARIRKGIEEIQKDFPIIADIRGRGLMLGIEFADPGDEKDIMGHPVPSGKLAAEVQRRCFEKGLIMEKGGRNGSTMRCLCALNVSDSEIDTMLTIFREAVKEAADA